MHVQKVRFTILDLILILLILVCGAWFLQKAHAAIDHEWNWGLISDYVFFKNSSGHRQAGLLLKGFLTTLRLSIWSMILALMVGAIFGLLRAGRSLAGRLLAATYTESIRNIPPLVLIFIFYFILSDQILPVMDIEQLFYGPSGSNHGIVNFFFGPKEQIGSFLAAVITLSLFEAAYIAEIVRGGIQSVDPGQWEASAALGMGYFRQMSLVVLPQTIPRILPPLTGQFVSTIKDSAIVSVISIRELTFQGTEIMSATYLTFEVWALVTLLYLVLTLPCSRLASLVENRLRKKYR
jgi:polar amino acid transport system permease protein